MYCPFQCAGDESSKATQDTQGSPAVIVGNGAESRDPLLQALTKHFAESLAHEVYDDFCKLGITYEKLARWYTALCSMQGPLGVAAQQSEVSMLFNHMPSVQLFGGHFHLVNFIQKTFGKSLTSHYYI